MSKTHWNTIVDTKYLSGEEIIGSKPILTIKEFKREEVTGDGGRKENCGIIYWHECVKPMIVNVTNVKRITKLFNSPYKEDWIGKQIQLTTEKTKAFGKLWNAIRVCEQLPPTTRRLQETLPQTYSEPLLCSDCSNEIEDCNGYTAQQIAKSTLKTYGMQLCMSCGNKQKQGGANNAEQ